MTVVDEKITLRRPDDWHTHLRDGEMLKAVLPATSAVFARAIVMPNLIPPITSIDGARAYRQRILKALPAGHTFQPLMTCYLTDDVNADEIEKGFTEGLFSAAKLYPAHATTNASYGVSNIQNLYPLFERMQKTVMPLLIHGEVTNSNIDIFDREARFIDSVLLPLRKRFPELKIVFEHITTKEAAEYVHDNDNFIAATITPQHLMFNRSDMLSGGIRPHLYCLPVLKRNTHQQALRRMVASGHPRFFAGTDTAPHARHLKESPCGCAGVFNAPVALSAYATVFEELNALHFLSAFCAENGARFYGLPLNEGSLTLRRQSWTVPETITTGEITLVPFLAGHTLHWQPETEQALAHST